MRLSQLTSTLLRPWLWFSPPIDLKKLHPNPFVEFSRWYILAQRCIWLEFPDAFCLSTVSADLRPDSRMVLLKDFDQRGFVFFSNYNSVKGQQLLTTSWASMTFFWDALQRQVRVRGIIETTTSAESDEYFSSRSRGSQIGAWASMQSQKLDSRENLDKSYLEFSNQFKDIAIPRPDNWGGFRLKPLQIEFWKSRAHRLHDRFLYTKNADNEWEISRLHP